MPDKNINTINKEINDYKKQGNSVKEISDGYHTFSDLYHHRMILTKVIAESYPDNSWKSWQHHDGSMFKGDFIVGFNTPEGQYTYHYKAEFWDSFNVQELEYAPEYDGHQPEDIERLLSLIKN